MKLIPFQKVWVDRSVREHKKTKEILERISNPVKVEYFDQLQVLIKSTPPVWHPKERSKTLVLTAIKGEIVKKCPGTHGHICCNYHVINQYIGCPIGCSYCILQGYLNQPFTVINVDIETIFEALEQIEKQAPDRVIRIGTGELGDSLVYDHLTHFSDDFIHFFQGKDKFIFEFKTKSVNVERLLQYRNSGNIVVGFSINPDIFRETEEGDAAPIEARIKTAERLAQLGYRIALHFDPIVPLKDAGERYGELIKRIFSSLKVEDIAWISLGTFRYTTELKSKMEYNYRDSPLLSQEFMLCADEKFRYFRPIRVALYRMLIRLLKDIDLFLPIYLCMESPEVWLDTLGFLPGCAQSMEFLFQRRGVYR